jgi:hypothetical protein
MSAHRQDITTMGDITTLPLDPDCEHRENLTIEEMRNELPLAL